MAFDVKQQVKRVFDEIWSEGHIDYIDECFDPSYRGLDPMVGKLDVSSLKNAVRDYRSAFPDLKLEVQEIMAEGDKVTACWAATGTHKGSFLGYPATGKKTTVNGITLFELRNGKIVRDFTQWDAAGLMRELGMLHLPTFQRAEQPEAPGVRS